MSAAQHPQTGRRRNGLALLAAGVSLALYAATAAPWLTWAHDGADGGDLIAAAMTGGVPHPSGYPLYSLLGRLFAQLPLGSIAFRFNLFSAVAAAVSVALVFLLVCNLLGTQQDGLPVEPIALGAALVWAAGPTLWSQAIIAEVYALHALFVALIIYLASRTEALERPRAWLGLGLATGLGLSNHLTLTLVLPGVALWLLPMARPRRLGAALGGLALGLLVYLYIPLAARGDPPVSWGDARNWAGFWWLVSGQPYRVYLFALPLPELPRRLAVWAGLWREQLTLLGVGLALVGLETRRRYMPRGWPLAGLLIVVLTSAYAIGYNTVDSYVYLLPAYLVGVTWLAQGALAVREWFVSRTSVPGAAASLMPLFLALWLVGANYSDLDLRRDNEVAIWATSVQQEALPGAILISGDDGHTFALDYIQWVEGERTELVVVDAELLPYAWYQRQLVKRYPDLADVRFAEAGSLIIERLEERPIYLTTYREELEEAWVLEQQGVLWRVMRNR